VAGEKPARQRAGHSELAYGRIIGAGLGSGAGWLKAAAAASSGRRSYLYKGGMPLHNRERSGVRLTYKHYRCVLVRMVTIVMLLCALTH
jgi:hypothetical protein